MNYRTLKAGETDPSLGKVIKSVILTSNTFIVYIDEQDVIQWSTEDHTTWGDNFGKIQNKVSYWESICNRLFNRGEAYDYKTLLAEAYARMLDDGDDDAAMDIIAQTVIRIQKQGKEVLRQQYIISSLLTAVAVIIILVAAVINKKYLLGFVDYDAYRVFLTGLFGGVGAFVSTMIRARNYEAEITLGKRVHRLDGFMRIVYGLIAGGIISLGIKANIILGFIKDAGENTFVEIFIGVIGGASEVLLPNIIKKVENKG